MTLNISSFVGAIMMVGIVGEKSVFFIHDAREEMLAGRSMAEAWARAAERRFRAVAMTTLRDRLRCCCRWRSRWGAGAQLQQPLAIAVIGGFILSGPLVLLILPALYGWLDPRMRLAKRGEPDRDGGGRSKAVSRGGNRRGRGAAGLAHGPRRGSLLGALRALLAPAAGLTSTVVAVIRYSIVTLSPTSTSAGIFVDPSRATSQRSFPFWTAIMSPVTSRTGPVT